MINQYVVILSSVMHYCALIYIVPSPRLLVSLDSVPSSGARSQAVDVTTFGGQLRLAHRHPAQTQTLPVESLSGSFKGWVLFERAWLPDVRRARLCQRSLPIASASTSEHHLREICYSAPGSTVRRSGRV